MSESASQITVMLDAASRGDEASTARLLSIVYDELRDIASAQMRQERSDHTLQATALVHEAYMRLLGNGLSWQNRRHFFGAAAEAMRRILVDHARARGRLRRGGDLDRIGIEHADRAAPASDVGRLDFMLLDDAIRRMEEDEPRMAEVVKLRFFAGLSVEDTAQTLGLSGMTVTRIWRCARAWLRCEVEGDDRATGR